MRKTCKRLRELAGVWFERKYGSKWLHLRKNISGKVAISPKFEYEKCFEKRIKNIIFEGEIDYKTIQTTESLQLPSAYLKYKQIQLKTIDFGQKFGDDSKEVLENLVTIGLWNCPTVVDVHANFLKYCKNMKNLIVVYEEGYFCKSASDHTRRCFSSENSSELQPDGPGWISQSYSTLEQLQFSGNVYVSSRLSKELKEFLRKNPNIRSLAWQFYGDQHYTKYSILPLQNIKEIVEYCTGLEELYLSSIDYIGLVNICEELQILCERSNFKRLEIKLISTEYLNPIVENTDALGKLKKLMGIHLWANHFSMQSRFPNITSLQNLESLQIQGRYFLWKDEIDNVARSLPNLKELFLTDVGGIDGMDIVQYVTPFVVNSRDLGKIMIHVNDLFDELNQIPMFSEWRKNLKDAIKLTIHLDERNCGSLTDSIKLLNAKNGLVVVKVVRTITEGFDVENPFRPFLCEAVEC